MLSSPLGWRISSPRMMLTTFESFGSVALASGCRPPRAVVSGTSNSTICTCPSANTSVWRAAGMPIRPLIAFAVSSSEETMKSTSISRSRHASRYSTLVVRTTTIARLSFLTSIARDEVRLLARGARDEQAALLDARLGDHPLGRPVALDDPHVVAVGERLQAVGVGVDHRDLVLLVERVHDRPPHVSRPEHDDPHARQRTRDLACGARRPPEPDPGCKLVTQSAQIRCPSLRAVWDGGRVTATSKHREVESRFRDLLAEAQLPAPDDVGDESESVVFYWYEPKVAVAIDFDGDSDAIYG